MRISGSGDVRSTSRYSGAGRASRSAPTAADPQRSKRAFKMSGEAWKLIAPRWGVLTLGFGLMIINRLAGLVLPGSLRYLLNDVIYRKQYQILDPLILAIVGATIIQGITSYSLTQLLSKSSQRMINDLRVKVQAHIGRLPVTYYDANKSGVLVSRIMSDVEGVRNLIGTGLVDFVGGILTAIFVLFILLKTSVSMTVAAAIALVIFATGMFYAFKTIRPIFRARPKINAEVTGRLTESLGGVRVVKGYHAEEREEKVFQAGVGRLLDNVLQTLTATSLMMLSGTVLTGIVSATIMYMGVHRIEANQMNGGDLITYMAYMAFLMAPVASIVGIGPQITEAMAGLERTREVLNEQMEDVDPGRTVRLDRVDGSVVFEKVDFSYDTGKQVLFDVSFESAPDTVTALVGPSGAGKSTIIGLIAAFYKPAGGRVLIDGVDLSTVRLDSYRSQLGVVLQETFLFDGTIRENVAFARPNASEDEILAACRIARVDEFAENFELKYETVVGERGVKLSGGQKQRVSIARAILADPRILILDEATSSLDSESEALIQEGLRYLMRGRTTFVIAHRLSTVRRADQILVIEAGRVIERGTHESLYAESGRYYDLYTKQHGVETNLFLAPGEGDKIEADDATTNGAGGVPQSRSSALADTINLIRQRNS
ncbi:MAG TPA: ABC transporter ATP-binding protein [Candidatus Acidoferrum sp.]|jgi:ABC-type multidrug transport system fused ATPase/permease subunit|nr:ABC transporter ATP-binding protein [Candidatus Acidoferrum sp.]